MFTVIHTPAVLCFVFIIVLKLDKINMEKKIYRSDKTKDLNLVIQVLKNYLSSEDFKIKSFDIFPASDDTLGFLGEHLRITVNYVFKNLRSTASFFYKTMPISNQIQCNHNRRHNFFERETFFHNNIFSQYKKFDGSLQCIPKCYHASGDDLVFEDLSERGFLMRDLREPMNSKHASVVMKGLARFHACSFIFEETKSLEHGRIFRIENELKPGFKGGSFVKGRWYFSCMQQSLQIISEISKKYGKGSIYYGKMVSKWDGLANKAIELIVKPSAKMRNVVLHFDLWNNNIMFRYDEAGCPIQCMFVDYQACCISKPSADVIAFLYLCFDKETKDEIFNEMIEIYYEELSKILKESDFDVENILPINDFKMSCEEYRLWGLTQGQVLYQFLFLEDCDKLSMVTDSKAFEKLGDGDRVEEVLRSLNVNEDYKKRIVDMIEEFIERYII